jgi:hypothetical protein
MSRCRTAVTGGLCATVRPWGGGVALWDAAGCGRRRVAGPGRGGGPNYTRVVLSGSGACPSTRGTRPGPSRWRGGGGSPRRWVTRVRCPERVVVAASRKVGPRTARTPGPRSCRGACGRAPACGSGRSAASWPDARNVRSQRWWRSGATLDAGTRRSRCVEIVDREILDVETFFVDESRGLGTLPAPGVSSLPRSARLEDPSHRCGGPPFASGFRPVSESGVR